jgi:prohibitin 1
LIVWLAVRDDEKRCVPVSSKKGAKTMMNNKRLIWVIFGLALLLVSMKPFKIINAGQVGIVYRFGKIVGQIDEGFNFIWPWEFVSSADVRVQRKVLDKVASFSSESQDVFVNVSLNYQVSPQTIQNLYRTVGADYYHILIEPRLAQNFKDETVKFKSVDIAPNRERIRQSVRARLEKELAPYSIHIVDLLLDNVDFNPEFKKSIENKQIATQQALEEGQRIEASKAKAQQNIEQQRGVGAAALARAEQEALANKKLSESLTPLLVQREMVQKLGDKIQIMVVPQGQGLLFQVPGLTK